MTDWFARPVLHVANVEASLRFYIDRLGFTSTWRYDEGGRTHVAQVDRQGCALILADTWPEKIGKALMFVSLNVEPATSDAAIAAVDTLRAELEAKGVLVKEGSWGYRLLVVDDPDGNQLFFNYPSEAASGQECWRRSLIIQPGYTKHHGRATVPLFRFADSRAAIYS
jgi:catechol 2,3-dioxygenase-like lactoylglutathione lyase family enzyme